MAERSEACLTPRGHRRQPAPLGDAARMSGGPCGRGPASGRRSAASPDGGPSLRSAGGSARSDDRRHRRARVRATRAPPRPRSVHRRGAASRPHSPRQAVLRTRLRSGLPHAIRALELMTHPTRSRQSSPRSDLLRGVLRSDSSKENARRRGGARCFKRLDEGLSCLRRPDDAGHRRRRHHRRHRPGDLAGRRRRGPCRDRD